MPLDIRTPYVVYHADVVARQIDALHDYLGVAYPNYQVFFSLKTCYLKPVVELLLDHNCGLNLISRAERDIGRYFRVPGEQIVWSSSAITETDAKEIAEDGDYVNADSLYQLELLTKYRPLETVGVRVSAGNKSRLGITLDDLEAYLGEKGIKKVGGLSFHVFSSFSSGIEGAIETRLRIMHRIRHLEESLDLRFDYLDIGGGLRPEFSAAENLGPIIEVAKSFRSCPRLFVEPGSWVVEMAASAYATVVNENFVAGKKWVTLDLGHNFLVPLDRASFDVQGENNHRTKVVRVGVGGLGFEKNVVQADVDCDLNVGDRVQIKRCGAYSESMMSCAVEPPPPIFWHQKGVSKRILPHTNGNGLFMKYHGY